MKNLSKITILLLTLTTCSIQDVFIQQPDELKSQIKNFDGKIGYLDYSVSTFGYLDYQAASRMQVLPVGDDKDGCNIEDYEIPETDGIQRTFNTAFLMKRGGCSYFQKAEMTRRAGGNLAIVALTDPDTSPDQIIPISSKQQSDNIPPLILIKMEDGEKIFEAANEFTSQPKNDKIQGKGAVYINVDFDMKKYIGNLRVKIWVNPNLSSIKFLIGFLSYAHNFNSKINLNVVFRIKSKYEYNYEDAETIQRFCLLNGEYCVGPETKELFDQNPVESIHFGALIHNIITTLSRMGKHEALNEYLDSILLQCIVQKGYEDKDIGYMLGCAKTQWKNNNDLTKLIPISVIEEQLITALTPITNRHDIKVIDFLENAKKQSYYYDYQSTPSMFINGDLVRGVADPDLALGAICDSMKEPIIECSLLHKQQIDRLKKLYKERDLEVDQNINFMRVVIFILMVFIFFGGYLFFKKMIVSQMNKDIETYAQLGVSEYHRVREDGDTTRNNQNSTEENQFGISGSTT